MGRYWRMHKKTHVICVLNHNDTDANLEYIDIKKINMHPQISI